MKTLQQMCFPVNIVKFLRTPFFVRWLFLYQPENSFIDQQAAEYLTVLFCAGAFSLRLLSQYGALANLIVDRR